MTYRFVFVLTALFITQVSSAQLFGEQQIISAEFAGIGDIHIADLDGDEKLGVMIKFIK